MKFLFLALLGILVLSCGNGGPSKTDLCARAEVAIKAQLVSPRSAHFQPCDQMDIQQTDFVDETRHEWVVSGYVDADNAFGASLRQNFSVDLLQVGDSWTVRSAGLR